MMNDTFSLLLRRHVLKMADERPADGQLETVLRATSRTRQRRSWLVRLRWLVDPAAPFSNAQVRYGAAALALLVVTAMIAILAAGALGGRTVFEGRWTATDTTDRSTQTLVIGDGRSPSVHFEDDFSIDCQRRGDTSTAYVADGIGEIQDGRLVVRYASGGCVLRLAPYDSDYTYDAATGTLLDDQSVRWVRTPPP